MGTDIATTDPGTHSEHSDTAAVLRTAFDGVPGPRSRPPRR